MNQKKNMSQMITVRKTMNKKCIVSILLFLAVLFCICSCANDTDCVYCEEEFEKGLELGKEEMFLSLFNSICMENEMQLSSGETWKTNAFKLTLTDSIKDGKPIINYLLVLENSTVEEIHEFEEIFFCMYAYGEKNELILSGQEFIFDGVINYDGETKDYLEGNVIEAYAYLPDNAMCVTIIISTKGELYNAFYYVY